MQRPEYTYQAMKDQYMNDYGYVSDSPSLAQGYVPDRSASADPDDADIIVTGNTLGAPVVVSAIGEMTEPPAPSSSRRGSSRVPSAKQQQQHDRQQPLFKAYEITSVKMLEDLMAGPDNVAIDFYKKNCPYCKTLAPIWNQIARQIHTTNNEPNVAPIIVAKMDGVKHMKELDELRPGWSDGRGYPSLLFKRVNAQDGSVDAVEWDHKTPRTYDNLLNFMAEYYNDPSLKAHSIDLVNLMRNPNPEFTFMYSNSTPVVLRFSQCLNQVPMVDISEGNVTCAAAFYRYPELARRGVAIPVNELDRQDFPIPAVVDNVTGKEYRYRDCQRWIQQQIQYMNADTE